MYRILSLIALVGLAACTNPNNVNNPEYLNGSGTGAGTGAATETVTQFDPNDPANLDPSSAAFFSKAVGDRVLFDVDQYVLNAAGKAALDAQAQWLKANLAYTVVIEGHADEQGTREYNLALGARRARSVQEYLLSQGVASTRLRTLSYGKERPIEICSQENCYANNRRAVTVLAGGIS